MDESSLRALRGRLGDNYLMRRLHAQFDRQAHIAKSGRGGFHLEHIPHFMDAVELVLRASGLYARGQRNALDIVVRERVAALHGLAPALAGLRVLQISDLHLDGYRGLGSHIAAVVAGQHFDACVLTGDFRYHDKGRYDQISAELADLVPALACPYGVYGILGNHDYIEMVSIIEVTGVRMLINEAVALERNGSGLWLVGVDDPHFYGMHDFDRALATVPVGAMSVLLAHSPEVIPEASRRGFGLYLTGHTHGGQICLPDGRAPYMNARCPRRYMSGPWRYGRMDGYTSLGVGASGVFVRFHCPPEIVIHELQPA